MQVGAKCCSKTASWLEFIDVGNLVDWLSTECLNSFALDSSLPPIIGLLIEHCDIEITDKSNELTIKSKPK